MQAVLSHYFFSRVGDSGAPCLFFGGTFNSHITCPLEFSLIGVFVFRLPLCV